MKKTEYISKKYGKTLHIWDSVFRENVWVLISSDKKDYIKLYKNNFNENPPMKDDEYKHTQGRYSVGRNDKTGTDVHIIWIKKKIANVIAHETNHCVNEVLRHKGIPQNEHTDEIYAYYQQFLVKEITENY